MKNLKKKIVDLKYNAYLLKKKSQIPSKLYDYISKLNINDDIGYIKLLMFLSEQSLRMPNFYNKYKDVHNDMNGFIEKNVHDYMSIKG